DLLAKRARGFRGMALHRQQDIGGDADADHRRLDLGMDRPDEARLAEGLHPPRTLRGRQVHQRGNLHRADVAPLLPDVEYLEVEPVGHHFASPAHSCALDYHICTNRASVPIPRANLHEQCSRSAIEWLTRKAAS